MTEADNFLSRWSRKKRGAVEEAAPAAGVAVSALTPAEATDGRPSVQQEEKKATDVPFDPASLPSLDSIGAQTDVRAFLQAGVPADLTRAALRRAWTADPAILNFKGLQENDWDFNDPNSMFGFGKLDADFDVERMLASVFGETPKEPTSPSSVDDTTRESSPVTDGVAANGDHREPDRVIMPASDETGALPESPELVSNNPDSCVVQRTANIATQQDEPDLTSTPHTRTRSHGGALPR
jgi:hypothetical protein